MSTQLEPSESIIRILDEVTANKIAAGEVVERPASIVKELIENSIDAGATMIRIELVDGGKKFIRVIDNGTGMSRDDALMSLKRHATSKIKFADDLFCIRTLGFRGEALPSISSVSHMEILTRKAGDEFGTLIECTGGDVTSIADAGSPTGTSITVRDLFYNVPARQKFLRTAQTELGHIVDLVNRYAISHYYIDITLFHNEKNIFRSVPSDDIRDSILTVFGRDAAESIVPVNGEMGQYKITGYVSRPSFSKTNRTGQLFYVNHRFVRNRNLIHALDEAYKGILPQGRFPLFIGFVEVDPELVDVNVHPTKIEVKFVREWEVHNLLYTSIRKALSSEPISPMASAAFHQVPTQMVQRPTFLAYNDAKSTPLEQDLDMGPFREAIASRIGQLQNDIAPQEKQSSAERSSISEAENEDMLSDAVVLAQARNMYIIAQSPKGVLIIDQHVAHERILHDKLLAVDEGMAVQRLMIPLTLTLNKREALVLANKVDDFKALGFEVEPFGKDAFMVRTIPAMIADKDYEQVLRDTIEELTDLTVARRLMVHRESVITTTACKMAVKAGDKLSYEEMTRLITELRCTSNPYLCPHGRPIVVCITNHELDKMFGRV